MAVRRRVPWVSLELPAFVAQALRLFLARRSRQPASSSAGHGTPWSCRAQEKYPVIWVGRIYFFSPDPFKALVTKAQ